MTTATKPTWAEQLNELAEQREEARAVVQASIGFEGLADYYEANEAWLAKLSEGLSGLAPRIVDAIADVTVWAQFQGMADKTEDVEMKRYYQRTGDDALIRFDEGMTAVKGLFEALGSVSKSG